MRELVRERVLLRLQVLLQMRELLRERVLVRRPELGHLRELRPMPSLRPRPSLSSTRARKADLSESAIGSLRPKLMSLGLVFRHQLLQGQQKFRLLLRVQGLEEEIPMRLKLDVFPRNGGRNENLGVVRG